MCTHPLVDEEAARGAVHLRTDVPHAARVYSAYLGGKDNFPADRDLADKVRVLAPNAGLIAEENRGFHARSLHHMVASGVRQFLDIGCGFPTGANTHDLAQRMHADARVLYVDNDPMVAAHARALMASGAAGTTAFLPGDLRDPQAILTAPQLTQTLDLDQPVGVLLIAVVHFLEDSERPADAVRALVDALAPGSFLAISHVTGDFAPQQWEQLVGLYRAHGIGCQARSRDEIRSLLTGLAPVAPGLELVSHWRRAEHPEVQALGAAPISAAQPAEADVACYGAVAQKI